MFGCHWAVKIEGAYPTEISTVDQPPWEFAENGQHKKISNDWQQWCGGKWPIDVKGQNGSKVRMCSLVGNYQQATASQRSLCLQSKHAGTRRWNSGHHRGAWGCVSNQRVWIPRPNAIYCWFSSGCMRKYDMSFQNAVYWTSVIINAVGGDVRQRSPRLLTVKRGNRCSLRSCCSSIHNKRHIDSQKIWTTRGCIWERYGKHQWTFRHFFFVCKTAELDGNVMKNLKCNSSRRRVSTAPRVRLHLTITLPFLFSSKLKIMGVSISQMWHPSRKSPQPSNSSNKRAGSCCLYPLQVFFLTRFSLCCHWAAPDHFPWEQNHRVCDTTANNSLWWKFLCMLSQS